MNPIESPRTSSEPERSKPERWFSLRRWLGGIGSNTREDRESVSDGKVGGANDAAGSAADMEEEDLAGKIFDAALAEYKEQTKNEAGRPEGRTFPELVVGPQVYPNPRMWRPDTNGVPLTEDEHYGAVARMLDKIDREDGFDGLS